MARENGGGDGMGTSTQNTQYDEIGTNYMAIKEMGAVEAELPSVVAALGRVDGKRCLGMLSFLFHFWGVLIAPFTREMISRNGESVMIV
jgi:hypothetical protein